MRSNRPNLIFEYRPSDKVNLLTLAQLTISLRPYTWKKIVGTAPLAFLSFEWTSFSTRIRPLADAGAFLNVNRVKAT